MNILHIRLFFSPYAYYCFDINKNELLRIDKSSFDILQECLASNNYPMRGVSREIDNLLDLGYLSARTFVQTVHHHLTDFIGLFLSRKLSSVTLQLTQNCNFRCKYCIYSEEKNARQRGHSNNTMSFATAKKAIDFLWENSIDSESVNVGFYGGEPLLEFELIKRMIEYSKQKFFGKKINFHMTTNASLLNEDFIRYFAREDVSMMISLDGPKAINDKNRVFADGQGTFDTVMSSIRLIHEIDSRFAKSTRINMVIDPRNDYDCLNELRLTYEEINDFSLQMSLLDYEYDGLETSYDEAFLWKGEYQRFLALLSHVRRFPSADVSPIARRALESLERDVYFFQHPAPLRERDVPSGPCVPGKLRLFINVFGEFYPCERVSEKSAAMKIGDLESGFDFQKIDQILNVGKITEEQCKNCFCFRSCKICAKKADNGSDTLASELKIKHCSAIRDQFDYEISQYILLAELPEFYSAQLK